jgi:hypothetical protein
MDRNGSACSHEMRRDPSGHDPSVRAVDLRFESPCRVSFSSALQRRPDADRIEIFTFDADGHGGTRRAERQRRRTQTRSTALRSNLDGDNGNQGLGNLPPQTGRRQNPDFHRRRRRTRTEQAWRAPTQTDADKVDSAAFHLGRRQQESRTWQPAPADRTQTECRFSPSTQTDTDGRRRNQECRMPNTDGISRAAFPRGPDARRIKSLPDRPRRPDADGLTISSIQPIANPSSRRPARQPA